nr:hypothetical protein [Candidatus Dormibacteraeota bacterium]
MADGTVGILRAAAGHDPYDGGLSVSNRQPAQISERRTGVVEYTRLGNSGLKVSRIALGCMSFGDTSRGFSEWA